MAVLLFCCYSAFSHAWGPFGHRVSASVAQSLLTPAAQKEVDRLLPAGGLIAASTYADEMRSDPSHFWQKTASPWHYVTVPKGQRYSEALAPPQGDAYTALQQFRRDLVSPTSSFEDKQLALRFIVHIVGDLHQPMHAGNGLDRGGNQTEVWFYGKKTNMHRLWDGGLFINQSRNLKQWHRELTSSLSQKELKLWGSTNPLIWITESARLRDRVYPEHPHIGEDYQQQHLPAARLRLQQAGIRLAAYLNEVFATTP